MPAAPPSNVDEVALLIEVLPARLQAAIQGLDRSDTLVEIVMDLGRHPEARMFGASRAFEDIEVELADIEHVLARIGDFGDDNRAGVARTLHRISCIRNRKGRIIGLTLRVGRAVYGTVEMIRDIVLSGQSVLLLGRPGVGKTTMLRETARVLADSKRVVIVDTSNEIAGDGDIPHPAIGRARRMQVRTPALQHEVMIEAVENHNPQVVVIDEIGRETEAEAARTIAERGVQLIGTAHGNTLSNLLMNPTLSDLIGGIESVTLSDEEARRRGTQKSVLERRAPPTFDVLVEIQDWYRVAVHHDIAAAVDTMLRGRELRPELRYVDDDGNPVVEAGDTPPGAGESEFAREPDGGGRGGRERDRRGDRRRAEPAPGGHAAAPDGAATAGE
ncbi:AAA family ATPase, partial [bacterium]